MRTDRTPGAMRAPLRLEARNVSKTFHRGSKKAVDDVSIAVGPGDFVAVVGESGSGKSTLARLLLGLLPADEGAVEWNGTSLKSMNHRERLAFRSSVQCVLQDPSAALNPRKTVGRILSEVITLHSMAEGRRAVEAKVAEALDKVELTPASGYMNRLPHELSGGQRQRVLIARAIALDPEIIVADEAVSALDVSVKVGVLKLLMRLREEMDLGFIFITHDLPVVKKVADHVYVMRHGRVVEQAPTSELFSSPVEDYTRELLAASPAPDPVEARGWIQRAQPV